MIFIDGTAVNVALPVLQRDFHASAASLQWVVEGYSLFLSALVLIGGSLGDHFGRKRVFGIGIALFALASFACALAGSMEMLIVARCAQGVGGALATPGSLALLSATFEGARRGRAIGTWSGASAMTAAAGPLLGGWLVQVASWRWVFIINLPLAALVLFALGRVAESRDVDEPPGLDFGGAALATLGLGGLVYGLIRLQGVALDVPGLWCAACGLGVLGLFVVYEARTPTPMLHLALFRSRTFAVTNAYTLLLYAALGGSFYFVPFDLINVQGYTPTAAGAALLPFVVVMSVFSRFSGGLVARIGARLPLTLGAILAAAGFAAFAAAGLDRSYWISFFPAALILGVGGALFVAPLTTTVMDSVPTAHAGIASGINNAVARTAGLIAVAALGIALASTFERDLSRELRRGNASAATLEVVQRTSGQILAGRVPDAIGGRERTLLAHAVANAYVDGFRVAMLTGAVLSLGAGILALTLLPRRRPA
jgi:EmrB/QacA subfamily drug resistance transporter